MPKPTKPNDRQVMRGEFSTVVDLDVLMAAEKDGGLPSEIPVLPKGEFMTLPYGNMVLNDDIFNQMIGNFKANVRRRVPVDVDHAWENTAAAGWVKGLSIKDDGLWASVKWNKRGADLVGEEVYKMISAEWSFDYVDPQKSTHHGAVLVAATLTNRPLMQSMPTITASENNLTNEKGIVILLNNDSNKATNMPTLIEILAKPVADRTEDDLKFLLENEADLSDEQKTQLDKEVEDANDAKAQADLDAANAKLKEEEDAKAKAEAEAAGKTPEEVEKEKVEAEAQAKADEEAKEAASKDVTIKAGELSRLQKMEADFKAAEVLKAAEDFIKPYLASDKGGKVLPAGKEAFVKLASSLNTEQKALLETVLKATSDQKVTAVAGQDNKEGLTATEQYNNLIKEAMEKGKSPAEANKLVRTEHKDIYKAFVAENK